MKKQTTSTTKLIDNWTRMVNPLRGLTKPQIDQMFDQIKYGNDVRLQLAFYEIERVMPIYGIVISKRLSGINNRQWSIERLDDSPESKNQQELVEKMFLQSDTRNTDGLTDCIRHLGLASFRGRSAVKPFINKDGQLYFKKIQNWNLLEYGGHLYWQPNPCMYKCGSTIVNELEEVPESEICCVFDERPIDIPGILIYLRQLVGEENWARSVEKYGVAQVVITAPEGTPDSNYDKWLSRCMGIFEGGSGVLPPGANLHLLTEPRNQDPFSAYCEHQSKIITLLALGGSLSTIGGSTGLGSDLADVQDSQFNDLVTYDCKRISNAITNTVIPKCVKHLFGNSATPLIRFSYVEKDTTTTKEYLEYAQTLNGLGVKIDIPELKRLTGLSIISDTQNDTAIWSPVNEQ